MLLVMTICISLADYTCNRKGLNYNHNHRYQNINGEDMKRNKPALVEEQISRRVSHFSHPVAIGHVDRRVIVGEPMRLACVVEVGDVVAGYRRVAEMADDTD